MSRASRPLLVALAALVLIAALAVLLFRLAGPGERDGTTGAKPPPTANSRPGGAECPGHPVPACVGVPTQVSLTDLAPNDGNAYRVSTPGTVIDGKHVAGDLVIVADGVTVRNSQIDGVVLNEYSGVHHSFTIVDSTIGPANGCDSLPGVGETDFVARRLLIRGHGDGFRVAGSNAVLEDSFVRLCSNPGDHSDGVQSYPAGSNVVIRNNTIDQRGVRWDNAPIFLPHVENLTLEGNLVMGGTYTLRVYPIAESTAKRNTVRDNKVVDGVWDYGPVDTGNTCDRLTWSGNELVTIDRDYAVESVVKPLACVN